jgi:hypothetical protein
MDLNRDTALKVDPHLVIQELHRLTSLNTVVCLRKLVLNQQARCPLNSLLANSLVNKVAMVDPPPNHQVNMPVSKWHTVALPVLVAMAVVSPHPIPNGVHPQLRVLAMALVAIRANVSFSISFGP